MNSRCRGGELVHVVIGVGCHFHRAFPFHRMRLCCERGSMNPNKAATVPASFIASLLPKPQQLHLPKLNACHCVAALEADATFVGHFSPWLPLEPFGHLRAVGNKFAVFPLREVDCVHDFAVEDDGDCRALGGEGHAVPFAGGFDGALGRWLMAEEGTAPPVGGLFLPWLGAVVADLDLDAGRHPVGFVAVVEDDATVVVP
jgi:hypothetical protein